MIDAVVALLFGLLIGSFLNVCIYRMPRDLSVVRPRSFCIECERQIAWYDNIPVVSYLVLGGRCRQCRKLIPVRYPIVEISTGLLFAFVIFQHGASLTALKLCLFSALLVGLFFSDLEERILPDEFTLGGTALGVGLAVVEPLPPGFLTFLLSPESPRLASVGEALLAAGVTSGALWSVGSIYERLRGREGLGFGDVKMVAMIGAFLGLSGALLSLVVGSLLGSVLGLLFIVITRKDHSSYELPFGSFLSVGALAVGVLGNGMLSWYHQLGQ